MIERLILALVFILPFSVFGFLIYRIFPFIETFIINILLDIADYFDYTLFRLNKFYEEVSSQEYL